MPGQNANRPPHTPPSGFVRMGAFGLGAGRRSVLGRGRVLAANLALHPDEPDGGDRTGLWVRRAAVAGNLALDPDEPDGAVWPDGGGGCALVSGRCCIWIRFGQPG
jgi:hypothetical protein